MNFEKVSGNKHFNFLPNKYLKSLGKSVKLLLFLETVNNSVGWYLLVYFFQRYYEKKLYGLFLWSTVIAVLRERYDLVKLRS